MNNFTPSPCYPFGHRHIASVFAAAMAVALLTPLGADSQVLTGVFSRKVHGVGAIPYELPVDFNRPINGNVAFESRALSSGMVVVFRFDAPINAPGTQTVVDDLGATVTANPPVISGTGSRDIEVTIPSLADGRRITVSLTNVNGVGLNVSASLGYKLGDTNQSGTLTITDVSAVKARAAQTVAGSTFLYDFNLSGFVTAADISAVKVRSGLFPVNLAPVVNAGTNQTVTLPAAATLAGSASDDGQPVPPGMLTVSWSRVSGPATVSFANPNVAATSANFTVPGSYVLRLTAFDGALTNTSDVTVTVNPGAASVFTVAGLSSPRVSGTAGSVTVTARDVLGNVSTGYTGTVHFTSSDGAATLPADYTFTAGDVGTHSFPVTLNTAGTQSVTVRDTVTASITGAQTGIVVNSAALPGLFEKPHPWNKDVSAFPVSSRSAAIIGALAAMGGWATGTPASPVTKLQVDFSIPIMFANSSTPRGTINAAPGYYLPDGDSTPLQMPLPLNGNTEGSETLPVPDYACDTANNDCHVLVVETSQKKLYELYNATGTPSSMIALGAYVWDLTKQYGDVLRGDQCTSADAAGLPMAALIPTADEVASGEVPHAIRFILRNDKMKKGGFDHGVFVRPATHAGGPSNTTNPDAPPYGVRFRLKATFDENAAFPNSPGARVIARALKKYGMILSDGGNIPLTFADDRLSTAKWSQPSINITSQTFTNMPVTQFEVVDLGPEIENTFNCIRVP